MTTDPYAVGYETLILDRVGTDGRVGRITLNRPDKLNALSLELMHELDGALHALEGDYETRVIIMRGAGRAFSSGYDMSPEEGRIRDATHRRADDQGRPLVMGVRASIQRVTDIHLYLWGMAKVTVAQLHGYCLAGGCELAMMADLVVAADDTKIGHPGTRMGVSRTGNIWPLVMGMRQAKELYLTGSSISGSEAERLGMINHSWPADELDDRTVAYADNIANMSSDHLAMLKTSMNVFHENMGLYPSVRSNTELDAASKFTAEAYRFHDRAREAAEKSEPLKDVIEFRDRAYQEDQL